MPQFTESAFDTDCATPLPEAARIILGHVAGGPAGQTVGDTPASAPETPTHHSGDVSDKDFQAGWGPMPSDQEPDD